MTDIIRTIIKSTAVALALAVIAPEAIAIPEPSAATATASASASAKKKRSSKRRTASSSKKKRSGATSRKKKSRKSSARRSHQKSTRTSRATSRRHSARRPAVQTLWLSPDSTSWIHKGGKGIIIYRDSTGITRAMQPCTMSPAAGRQYAEVISEYAAQLQPDSVQVYMLMAPSQGEYYMPEAYATPGAEQRCIEGAASYLSPLVIPVMVNDTLRRHLDEEIYNRTDHHWAPLGAYYAAAALAAAADVDFLPLSEYTPKTIRDYVGTMYKFSGDPQVKNAPEEFVYFLPKNNGYEAEFITYSLRGGKTAGESAPHREPFFKTYPDGSGAAYLTFMGGDTRTVKVTRTGGTPGRKLLIVKDSFGNAMASNLFGSFEEVHVVDFRFFPHNLANYARRNGITDMVFVNCVQLALNPNTASRLRSMLTHNDGSTFSEPEVIQVIEEEEEDDDAVESNEEEAEEEEAGISSDDDDEEEDDEEEEDNEETGN